MSTRCNIHFADKWGDVANIYRHTDGYPDGESGVLADLGRFFAAVEEQTAATGDTRFDDPEYLAARFVVWQASQNACPDGPLSFISVGVTCTDAGDAAYIYRVVSGGDRAMRPAVEYRKASEKRFRAASPVAS